MYTNNTVSDILRISKPDLLPFLVKGSLEREVQTLIIIIINFNPVVHQPSTHQRITKSSAEASFYDQNTIFVRIFND